MGRDVEISINDNGLKTRPLDEVLAAMGTSLSGLSAMDVQERKRLGVNELTKGEKESMIKKFLGMFSEPLMVLLLVSGLISLAMGETEDAVGIFVAITIVNTVGFYQERKSEQSIDVLRGLAAHTTKVIREGCASTIDSVDLVAGDIVVVAVGDRVPADCRLIDSTCLMVDESVFTGETEPKAKTDKETGEECVILMGSTVSNGWGKAVVIAIGDHTELGKISATIQAMQTARTPLQETMDEIGKKLSIAAFVIVGVIFLAGILSGKDTVTMFQVGVSLAVAAIPEGLPIVVTVTLALGVTRMAKRHAIIRHLPAVEALGCASVICSDKTGTLTSNEMVVSKVYCGNHYSVSGFGYHIDGDIDPINTDFQRTVVMGKNTNDVQLNLLLKCAVLCNNAELRHFDSNKVELVGQPTEGSLLVLAFKAKLNDLRKLHKRLEEIPFSSETKYMAVKYDLGDGLGPRYYCKGSLPHVLSMCNSWSDGGVDRVLNREKIDELNSISASLGAEGLRVVALATGADLKRLSFLGLVGIWDPPRNGVKQAIDLVIGTGVKVVMVTGDSKETAISVAKNLGIWNEGMIAQPGYAIQEVLTLGQQETNELLQRVAVFYRVSPHDKMAIVNAFQSMGHVVAMTGDGINDAPALKKADIGIAMGRQGTDVAKEAAEMILVDDNFATIVSAIEEGKCIYNNIKNFLKFQLTTSIATLTLVAGATLFGLPLPFNPTQILWINIIMDGPPAQSLGVEDVDADVMKSPYRKLSDPILSFPVIVSIITSATAMVIGTLSVFYYELNYGQEANEDPAQLKLRVTTMAFTTFVFFQMFNAANCRWEVKSAFSGRFLQNKFFLLAVGGSVVMQLCVIYLPPLQYLFDTTAASFADLVQCTLVASSVLLIDEIRKMHSRKVKSRRKYLSL